MKIYILLWILFFIQCNEKVIVAKSSAEIYSMSNFHYPHGFYDTEVDVSGPQVGYCLEADFEKGYGIFHLFHSSKKINIQFNSKNQTFLIDNKSGAYQLKWERNGSGVNEKKIEFFPSRKIGEKISYGYKINYSLEECLRIEKQNYEADLFTWGTSGAKQHDEREKLLKAKENYEKVIEEMKREEKEKEAEENEKLKK